MKRLEQIAQAIANRFKDRVSANAEMPFEETKVVLPNQEIWLDYARAAVEELGASYDKCADPSEFLDVIGDILSGNI